MENAEEHPSLFSERKKKRLFSKLSWYTNTPSCTFLFKQENSRNTELKLEYPHGNSTHSSVSPYLNDNQIAKAGSFRPAHLLLTLSQPTDLTRMAAFCNARTALWHHTGLQHITGMFQVYQTSSNMQIKHFFHPPCNRICCNFVF